jgi:hypothetical protein
LTENFKYHEKTYILCQLFCERQLQDSILEENAVHMSWQDGGQNSGHANEPYRGFLQHPDHDSTMQIGYVLINDMLVNLS